MHALDVLGDPVRRRILELIVDGEEPAGTIAAVIAEEFGISQPAVSQHLRVLRENGFVTVRPQGARRLYAVHPEGPKRASEWLSPFERFWRGPLAALGTELARGRRLRRIAAEHENDHDAARTVEPIDASPPSPHSQGPGAHRTDPERPERSGPAVPENP